MPVRPPPARTVLGARSLVDLGVGSAQQEAREEDDHAEAELLPHDHPDQRRERVVGIPEPVPRQAPESDLVERGVEQAVQREDLPEEHADDRDGQQVGDQDDAAVEAPARHALVEQDRDEERDRDDQRQPERDQRQIALDRAPKEGVTEDDMEIAEAHVRAVAMQRLEDQAVDAVAEHERDHILRAPARPRGGPRALERVGGGAAARAAPPSTSHSHESLLRAPDLEVGDLLGIGQTDASHVRLHRGGCLRRRHLACHQQLDSGEVALLIELVRDEVLEVRAPDLRHVEELLDLRDLEPPGVEAVIGRQRAGVVVERGETVRRVEVLDERRRLLRVLRERRDAERLRRGAELAGPDPVPEGRHRHQTDLRRADLVHELLDARFPAVIVIALLPATHVACAW